MTENCWCIDSHSEIENKLKDGYDNINLGLFNYSVYNSSCNSIVDAVIKDPSLSTDDFIAILEKALVYPNPTISDVNINLSKNIDKLELELYDVTGKLLFVSNYTNIQNIKLNLKELKQGNYIINLISGKEKIVKKIIKR